MPVMRSDSPPMLALCIALRTLPRSAVGVARTSGLFGFEVSESRVDRRRTWCWGAWRKRRMSKGERDVVVLLGKPRR